jgi:hypothetical protein
VKFFLPLVFLITASAAFSQTTTTLDEQTKNNTAACSAANSPSYCQAAMGSMSSAGSGTYNAAPGNVSKSNIHSMLYSGSTTQVFTYYEPWFCMSAGSTSTGTGSLCTSHIQVGYNSNDAATIHGQMDDIQSRGFDGLVIDSYGRNLNFYDSVSTKVRDDLDARCSGSACPMSFALMEDDGAFKWTQCPRNGGGIDQTACITQAINNDLDNMDANYFGSASYLKVDKVTKRKSVVGQPVIFYFFCEECFVNPVPNWNQIWHDVRVHTQPYAHGKGLFIFRNAPGFSHAEADGAFAWVNRYGTETSDPFGLAYLDNFYDTSVASANTALHTWGAAWKGFDDTNAAWNPTPPRVYRQQCGKTWIQTFKEMAHNGDYGANNQLPFLGVPTWNDYEEGTSIETGIDNCLTTLAASVSGTTLSWTPTFSSPDGSETTLSSYIIYDSTDGQNLTVKTTVAPGTHSIDLSTMNWSQGNHTLYVQAVGLPSVQNHLSAAVQYSATTNQAVVNLSPGSVAFPVTLVGVTAAPKTVTLKNAGSSPLNISGITTTGDFSRTSSCGSVLAAGNACSITVSFKPKAIGTRSGTLAVTDDAAGSPHSVPLSGVGTSVSLSPTSLSFSAQVVGTTSAAKIVAVTNRGSATLHVSTLGISGNFTKSNNCIGVAIQPGSSCAVSVRFRPTSRGTRTGTLSIYDDGGASPQRVSLSGTGS